MTTNQVQSIREYRLPAEVNEWCKRMTTSFRWAKYVKQDDPAVVDCFSSGKMSENVESKRHSLNYTLLLGPPDNDVYVLYKIGLTMGNGNVDMVTQGVLLLKGFHSGQCSNHELPPETKKVAYLRGQIAFVNYILDHNIVGFKKCNVVEAFIQRFIVMLRAESRHFKSNTMLMNVNQIAIILGKKYFHSIRPFTTNLNALAEIIESCGSFQMASKLYFDAYKLVCTDDSEHLQSSNLALNAGIACRRDGNYEMAEWAYVQYARHTCLCNKEIDWSTILNMYIKWGFQAMVNNLTKVLRRKHEDLLTKKMVSVQTCDDFRMIVDDFVRATKLVEDMFADDFAHATKLADDMFTDSSLDNKDTRKQCSKKHKKKHKPTSATVVSSMVNPDREAELERYHKREEESRQQQRDADHRRRTQIANERRQRKTSVDAKVEERDAELATRYNFNASGKHPCVHKETILNDDGIKEASIQAQKRHEFDLKLQEKRRIAELEHLASQVHIGHAIQCGH